VAEELTGNFDLQETKDKIMDVANIVREAAFSGREISAEDYDKAVLYMKEIRSAARQTS
jgi:hypothetical protein